MAVSELRLIKHCVEFVNQKDVSKVPRRTRGIYVLFRKLPRLKNFDVVYIGMAGGEKAGIRGRLSSHHRRKGDLWTHFSVFEVWDNIREEAIFIERIHMPISLVFKSPLRNLLKSGMKLKKENGRSDRHPGRLANKIGLWGFSYATTPKSDT
jgi:hypothetical protein